MIIINIDFNQIANSLVGPILGSIGTFFAFILTEQYKNYLERKNIAAAFNAEIEGVEQQYLKVTYPSLKQHYEQNGMFCIKISVDFFTVF